MARRPLMTLNDRCHHHTWSPQNKSSCLPWLQGTHRAIKSACRTDGSRQQKPRDTAYVGASGTRRAPSPCHSVDGFKGNSHGPVLSNIRGAKATCHLALLKTHGDGQEEERAGGGGAGRRLKAGPSLHPGFCRIHRLASGPSQHQHLHKPQRRAAHRHHGAQASGFDVQHSLC